MPESDSIRDHVSNYIHEGKQFPDDGRSMLLTVGRIRRLTGPGSLDFGGSEYAPAPSEEMEAKKDSPDDKFGWWRLEPGLYRVEFNESLSNERDAVFQLQPWGSALEAGITHPARLIRGSMSPVSTIVTVGEHGTNIKENARISELVKLI